MSRHEGVSCDSCIKGNFRGLRFKCLICYDYDLCATCYEAGATNTRHTADHPMQCILTRSDYDTYYGGETINSDTPQSYSCPYCGKLGYTETVLYDHVTTEHNETPYEVVCPICASLPGGEPNQVTEDFAAHLTMEHRGGGGGLGNNGVLREEVGVEVGVGRGVRRIPHPTRGSSGARTRRPNMHFSSSGAGSNSSGSNASSSRDREREREAMDPIAELLSQLSGVRRGLSGVSGSSGLGSVLGLGALGSLGGALGSLGANLSGPNSGSSSGIPTPSGRGTGRLVGLIGRENTGAFSELVNNGGQAQPQLERHQALRLPRRQTQVISAPTTFSSANVTAGAGTQSISSTSSAPSAAPGSAAGAFDPAGNSQLLLSRLGNVLKESKESNSRACQDRSLFIQDLILATLALGFDVDVERDLSAPGVDCNRENSPPNPVSKNLKMAENGAKTDGNSLKGAVALELTRPAEVSESTPPAAATAAAAAVRHTPPQPAVLLCDSPVKGAAPTPPASSSPVSTRPKQQPFHHNESKGRRVSAVRVPSASSSSSSSSSTLPSSSSSSSSSRASLSGSGGGVGGVAATSVAASMVRSRSHGTSAASGISASSSPTTTPSASLLRKPVRPQTSHPPPPPSSH